MNNKKDLFENTSVPRALAVMAFPSVVSQLILLLYNVADTWFVGQTNNPYMVAACHHEYLWFRRRYADRAPDREQEGRRSFPRFICLYLDGVCFRCVVFCFVLLFYDTGSARTRSQ